MFFPSKHHIRIIFLFALCSFSPVLLAQEDSNWNKIIIVDQLYPEYYTSYSFIPEKRKVRVLDSLGVKIGKIKKAKFDDLIGQLVQNVHFSDSLVTRGVRMRDPLKQYGLDSNWYKSNIIDLWDEYRLTNKIELNETELETSKTALLNLKDAHKNIKFPNNFIVNKQSVIDVQIIYSSDTLRLQANSSFPYMLSWYYFNNRIRLADSKISLIVYEMLRFAEIESENTVRLSGVNFETRLIDDLYIRYLLTGVLKNSE